MKSENKVFEGRMWELYVGGLYDLLISEMEESWPNVRESSASSTAECCRLAMLAHLNKGNEDLALLWKARALCRFALSGYLIGISYLLIPMAFQAAKTPDCSLGILDEVQTLLNNSKEESDPFHKMNPHRLVHEKKGYFYAFLKRDFESALTEYNGALTYTNPAHDPRGRFKVLLGVSLCNYLKATDQSGRNCAINDTRKLLGEMLIGDFNFRDLERMATFNLSKMLSGETAIQHFTPYELT